MAVYHLSGLGKSPGALTVPISAIYILQIAQHLGIKEAVDFFKISGEVERKGSYEKRRGEIECIIVFTSDEVIKGTEVNKSYSKWFGFTKNEKTKPEKVYSDFFNKLFEHMEKEFNFSPREFEMYFVTVNHQDFEDCFRKVGTTLNGLKDKEIWGNMVGGTNQINLAILSAGAFSALISRYYYLFQSEVSLLEPDWAEKPTKNNIRRLVSETLKRWYELPFFNLEIGGILKKIDELFQWKEKINEKELENEIRKLGLGKMFFPKLRRFLIPNEDGTVSKGRLFEKFLNISGLISSNVNNFVEWKKWAEEEGILHKAEIF